MTSQARRTEWFDRVMPLTALAGSGQAGFRLYSAIDQGRQDIKGATVTRLIGKIVLYPSVVTTLVEMHWGIVVVNADAAAAVAFPDADTEADRADWMIRGWLVAKSGNISDGSQSDRVVFDTRAQRILHSEEDQLMVILDASASGVSLNFAFFIRTLIKMPG